MTAIASQHDAIHSYFDAWNRRDPEAIVATFAPGGTYSDPSAGNDLSGTRIVDYAAALFAAFADLRFEVGDIRAGDDGVVVADWTMRGTNTGSLRGAPPTGGTIALPGVDVITVGAGGIESVRGFFDRQTLVEQLGLQSLALPYRIGPVTFGPATHLESQDPAMPGAIALTMIDCRTEEEVALVRAGTRQILPELGRMRGFLGMTAIATGRRLCTVSAWVGPEDTAQLRGGLHGEYTRRVFEDAVGSAGFTGIFVPQRLIRRVRCTSCARWQRVDGGQERCECGATLPAAPPAW